jgi:DNA-binding transcriptional LysR family regulator
MAMDVHVRDLRYFLEVARQLHFTRAAETLFISQPALSKQIRALERQLRVTLFDRERGDVRLTRAGAELVPYAEQMTESWEGAKRSLAKTSDCTLLIGMHTSPGRGLLPKVRARMVASCPGVELELRQVGWGDRTAGLSDRSTDAAFVWLPLRAAGPDRHRDQRHRGDLRGGRQRHRRLPPGRRQRSHLRPRRRDDAAGARPQPVRARPGLERAPLPAAARDVRGAVP